MWHMSAATSPVLDRVVKWWGCNSGRYLIAVISVKHALVDPFILTEVYGHSPITVVREVQEYSNLPQNLQDKPKTFEPSS